MVDVDTFLTTLYVMVDDFCRLALPPAPHPGPQAALSRSEVVTLALFGQWQGCGSERVTAQVVKTRITLQLATAERLREAETEPLHPVGWLHMRR